MKSTQTRTGREKYFQYLFSKEETHLLPVWNPPPLHPLPPPSPLCLGVFAGSHALHNSNKSIINILKFEPNGHKRIT